MMQTSDVWVEWSFINADWLCVINAWASSLHIPETSLSIMLWSIFKCIYFFEQLLRYIPFSLTPHLSVIRHKLQYVSSLPLGSFAVQILSVVHLAVLLCVFLSGGACDHMERPVGQQGAPHRKSASQLNKRRDCHLVSRSTDSWPITPCRSARRAGAFWDCLKWIAATLLVVKDILTNQDAAMYVTCLKMAAGVFPV